MRTRLSPITRQTRTLTVETTCHRITGRVPVLARGAILKVKMTSVCPQRKTLNEQTGAALGKMIADNGADAFHQVT
jgi:hypothetical protein